MGSAIYAQTGATQDAGAGAGAQGGDGQSGGTAGADDVVDAEIVDEDGKK
jgi:molecular chaperone DnaK